MKYEEYPQKNYYNSKHYFLSCAIDKFHDPSDLLCDP